MSVIFKVKRAHMIKIWLSTISSELLILRRPNLFWWYIIINQSFLWGKKNRITAFNGQGHSKGSKCECLSRWYLRNRPTFCYQNCYCGASSWAGISCKKINWLFSRSRSQQGLIWSNMTVSAISSELLILLPPNLVWWHIIMSWIVLPKIGLLCCGQGQGHRKSSKFQWLFIRTISLWLLKLL